MFISSNEKKSMLLRIEILETRIDSMINMLNTVAVEKKKNISKDQREKRNSYASAYYYRKKAEKAAAQQGKI
jgi:hypothetical protein